MPDRPQKKLLDRYEQVPEDVQEAIFSADNAEIIHKIGKENKLNVKQIGVLADEAGSLMLGVIPPTDFIKRLNSRLDVDKETVQKLAQEVNARIFAKIRKSLREVHNLPAGKTETAEGQKGLVENDEGKPISRIIKPRTAPFVVSKKEPEIEKAIAPTEEKPISASKFKEPPSTEAAEGKEEGKEEKEKTTENKGIFEERKKEEGFRSKPSFTEVPQPEESKPQYPGDTDPYREPVD